MPTGMDAEPDSGSSTRLPAGLTVERIRQEAAGYPERIVPDVETAGVAASHLKRYEFALPWCVAKDVLDAACGVGYGAALLADAARRVVGIDISNEAIAYARFRYARPNVTYLEMNLYDIDVADGEFDVVCSFETIEHVDDVARYLREVVRVLSPAGTYLASTPRAEETTHTPGNPHHKIEFSEADFHALLGEYFEAVELYGQRHRFGVRRSTVRRLDALGIRRLLPSSIRVWAGRALGTPAPTVELPPEDIVIAPDGREWATELVAVCQGPKRYPGS